MAVCTVGKYLEKKYRKEIKKRITFYKVNSIQPQGLKTIFSLGQDKDESVCLKYCPALMRLSDNLDQYFVTLLLILHVLYATKCKSGIKQGTKSKKKSDID